MKKLRRKFVCVVTSTGHQGSIALDDLGMNLYNPVQVFDKCPIGYCLEAVVYTIDSDGVARLRVQRGNQVILLSITRH